jgi:hypothetical protein
MAEIDDSKFISYPGHGVGLRNVGSYQASGHPYLTGSGAMAAGQEIQVSFPFVTKSVTVMASGSNPLIGVTFNATGSDGRVEAGKHILGLAGGGTSFTFNVKCKEIWIHTLNATSGFTVYGSLTNIATAQMYDLTGSGLTD